MLVFITTYIIAFTPLKEYIPGYTDLELPNIENIFPGFSGKYNPLGIYR